MSRALRCDRCHNYFTPGKANGEIIRFRNPTVIDDTCCDKYGTIIKRKDMMIKYLGIDDIADLCPKCTWYFKKFMDNDQRLIFSVGYPSDEDSQQEQGR